MYIDYRTKIAHKIIMNINSLEKQLLCPMLILWSKFSMSWQPMWPTINLVMKISVGSRKLPWARIMGQFSVVAMKFYLWYRCLKLNMWLGSFYAIVQGKILPKFYPPEFICKLDIWNGSLIFVFALASSSSPWASSHARNFPIFLIMEWIYSRGAYSWSGPHWQSIGYRTSHQVGIQFQLGLDSIPIMLESIVSWHTCPGVEC